ncbi:MAG: hypothetical protein HFH23_15695 [Ruminococcus sp.]|nr:hypothetical protein [Ruminococcus sp.]
MVVILDEKNMMQSGKFWISLLLMRQWQKRNILFYEKELNVSVWRFYYERNVGRGRRT